MKWKRHEKIILRNQRIVLPLIVLAVLLAILAFSSASKPVYAAPPTAPPAAPAKPGWLDPGDGGGTPPTNDIQGQVFNWRTAAYVVGVTVCVYDLGNSFMGSATTGCVGDFRIVNQNYIWPCTRYQVTVNGRLSDMGVSAIDSHWCQWSGYVTTDSNAHGFLTINLDTSTTVVVPFATLYSNTAYVDRIDYSTSSSHTETFAVNVGFAGYESSHSWENLGISFFVVHQSTVQYGKQYYALAWYRNDVWGNAYIEKTGIGAEVNPNVGSQSFEVPEYLPTPNIHQPNCGLPTQYTAKAYGASPNSGLHFTYTETGTEEWTLGFSGSVGLEFYAFSFSVDIACYARVTDNHTNIITLTIGPIPLGDTYHYFVLYTKGYSYTEPNGRHDDTANKGGLELHVWDAGAG